MFTSDRTRLASANEAPSYSATDAALQNAEELRLKRLQREGKVLYDKGPMQNCRGTMCCPVGGAEYATVPQYVKDRVDGELGEQTHDQYPAPCLLIPECAAICETSKCCVLFGGLGQSGPCNEERDAGQGRRRIALGLSIFLMLLASFVFIPVMLSVIDARAIVDKLYWNKVTVHITGKRVWNSGADATGILIKCSDGAKPLVVNPSAWPGQGQNQGAAGDPACGLTFEYKISPGGTVIDGPKDFANGKNGETAKVHNDSNKLGLCSKYMGSRKSACDECEKSMLVVAVAAFVVISTLVMSINEILGRWDRNYDINFSKATGLLGAFLAAPSTIALYSQFETNCAKVLLKKGTGEMARGSYTPNTLGMGQAAALEWTILNDPEVGIASTLCLVTGMIVIVRCLATLFIPTDARARDPVKLTDPWDLGVENLDEYTMKARLSNDSHQPKWEKGLKGFMCAVGCCPQCFVACCDPIACFSDCCSGLGLFACVLCIGHVILAPCHRICPCLFVDRPENAPAPRAKRGVVRPMSNENGNCEELWQQVKRMDAPYQQSMRRGP